MKLVFLDFFSTILKSLQTTIILHSFDKNSVMPSINKNQIVKRMFSQPPVPPGILSSGRIPQLWLKEHNFSLQFPENPLIFRVDQWTKIVNVMGTPTDDFIARLSNSTAMYVRSLGRTTPRPLEEVIPDAAFLTETENERAHLTGSFRVLPLKNIVFQRPMQEIF